MEYFIEQLKDNDFDIIRRCDCIYDVLDSFTIDGNDTYNKYMYMNLLNQLENDQKYMLEDIMDKVNEERKI